MLEKGGVNMVKVKSGAIIKDVPRGSLKWYKKAGWKILPKEKGGKKNATNTKKNAKKSSND